MGSNVAEFPEKVALRASLALTSSFVAASPFDAKDRRLRFTLGFSYARGAAGGYAQVRLEWSTDQAGTYLREIAVDPSLTVAQPDAGILIYGGLITLPQPQDGSAVLLLSPRIRRPDGMRWLKVSAREGSGLSPGTLSVDLYPELLVSP